MIKECPVTVNNDDVTVAKFDEISVQFPSIHREAKTVFVSYENGRYKIVDKPSEEPAEAPIEESTKPATKVAKPKKTTKSVKKAEKSEIGD